MNKAFVREPEVTEPRCPEPGGCGGIGTPVALRTVEALVEPDARAGLSGSVYYCPSPSCDVVYFDVWGQTVPRSALDRLVYPKSVTGPICACFGVTAEEIRAEALAGRRDQVRAWLERAESDEAKCDLQSPCGTSCVAEIRRLFLENFSS